jgi:hypothetical protein
MSSSEWLHGQKQLPLWNAVDWSADRVGLAQRR